MKKMLVSIAILVEVDVAEDTSEELCRELGQDVAANMKSTFEFEDEAAEIVDHEITDVDVILPGGSATKVY